MGLRMFQALGPQPLEIRGIATRVLPDALVQRELLRQLVDAYLVDDFPC